MGIWDTYENRVYVQGKTKREAALFRTSKRLSEKLGDSLSYHGVLIDGEERSVIIDDSDNLNEKIMHSLPGEDFMCGSLVEWADNHWLITEKDANNELRTRVKLLQCNFLLKWIDEDHIIHEQWCVIEDGVDGIFRYQDVACCPEHGSIYLAEIEASRAEDANQIVPNKKPAESSLNYSDLDECDGEDSWFEDDFDEEDTE